jgi:hypothetical protein
MDFPVLRLGVSLGSALDQKSVDGAPKLVVLKDELTPESVRPPSINEVKDLAFLKMGNKTP